MSHQSHSLDDMLARLPEEMPFPPTPDIAARIGSQLPERPHSRPPRSAIWVYAAAAIALIAITLALPGPRNAVADLLGLPGIRIEIVDRGTTTVEPTSIGSTLLFGDPTTLADSQKHAPFAITIPDLEDIREPDETWLQETDNGVVVSLIYAATDDLPEIGDTGVGMLLMQIQSHEDAPFLAKRVMGDGSLSVVTVNGQDGFWVENGELVVLPQPLNDSSGSSRRSGNVLIWNSGDTTYRLESALNQDEAIQIAESLTPFREPDGN